MDNSRATHVDQPSSIIVKPHAAVVVLLHFHRPEFAVENMPRGRWRENPPPSSRFANATIRHRPNPSLLRYRERRDLHGRFGSWRRGRLKLRFLPHRKAIIRSNPETSFGIRRQAI